MENVLRVAQFNISGGFYVGDESEEYLEREAATKVDDSLFRETIEIINSEQIDIVCFQEIITNEEVAYIENIMKNTELNYKEIIELSPCNLVKDTDCGLAILSKYPITNMESGLFKNPKLSKTTSSGNTYYTYDKGYLMIEVVVNGEKIKVLTHHGFPFRRFNSTPEANPKVFKEFDSIIKKFEPTVVTGDFNAERFYEMMDYTRENYQKGFDEVTTVDNMKFDNILTLNEKSMINQKTRKTLSDHFMLIADIKLK